MQDQYLSDVVRKSKEIQKEIFADMLKQLELKGLCRGNYHILALALFGDTMGEW